MEMIWTFLSTLLTAVVTAITEIIVTNRSQRYRELTITINDIVNLDMLLSDKILEDFRDEVTLHYGNQDLAKASVARFSLINTGKAPIKKEDFEGIPKFLFGPNAKLVRAKLVAFSPAALEPSIKLNVQKDHLNILPLLLNRSERMDIAVLGTNIEFVKPMFRFIGMSEIEPKDSQRILASLIRRDKTSAKRFLAALTRLIILSGIVFIVFSFLLIALTR